MPTTVLLDEKKSEFWPLALPGYGDKIRIQPSLAEFFDLHRPANVGKGDFLLHSTLQLILIKESMAFRFRDLQTTLGMLLGSEGTSVKSGDNGASR